MKTNGFHKYVLAECERQWNENQEEFYGSWDEQADDTKAEYYNKMYELLYDRMSTTDRIALEYDGLYSDRHAI